VLTVFPFLADPKRHLYLKPNVTRLAAERWGFPVAYEPRPNLATYRSLLAFAKDIRTGLVDARFPNAPRDQIDVQGFIWVAGSSEYD
jgi:hypothetical protein